VKGGAFLLFTGELSCQWQGGGKKRIGANSEKGLEKKGQTG